MSEGLDVKPPTAIAAHTSRQSPRLGSAGEMCVCEGGGEGYFAPLRSFNIYIRLYLHKTLALHGQRHRVGAINKV